MRILVLSNFYPPHSLGGYEQACFDTVEGLRARGHHVEVLTSSYGLEKPTTTHGIHRLLTNYHFCNANVPRRAHLLRLSCWNTHGTRSLRRLLRTVRPDVAYVWGIQGIPVSIVSTLQRADIPLVFTLQDIWMLDNLHNDPWFYAWDYSSHSFARRAVKKLLRQPVDWFMPTYAPSLACASVQYASAALSGIYGKKGCNFARERVIHNGINTDQFTMSRRCSATASKKLLFVGRLEAGKGVHIALIALAQLVTRFGQDAVTLTIVGAGTDRAYQEKLHQMVRDYDLENVVNFCGHVPRPEMVSVYAAHDIFVFPSSWVEGFGLVVLEALACGIPVVGTANGGTAELLEDEVTALVIPPEDGEALAKQVSRLVRDQVLAYQLGTAGAAMVRQRFDQSLIIRQVEDYLHEVVDAWARQPGRCWSKRFGTAQRDRQISRRETGTTPRGSRQ